MDYTLMDRVLNISLLKNPNRFYCNFDCIYCNGTPDAEPDYISVDTFKEWFAHHIKRPVDYIYYGPFEEAVLNPDYNTIMDMIIQGRDKYNPDALIVHSTNGASGDINSDILYVKIDAWDEQSFQTISKPSNGASFQDIIDYAKSRDKLYIQTMVMWENMDNFQDIVDVITSLNPDGVMLVSSYKQLDVNAEDYAKFLLNRGIYTTPQPAQILKRRYDASLELALKRREYLKGLLTNIHSSIEYNDTGNNMLYKDVQEIPSSSSYPHTYYIDGWYYTQSGVSEEFVKLNNLIKSLQYDHTRIT